MAATSYLGGKGEVSYNHYWKNAKRINDTLLNTFATPRLNSSIWFLGDLTNMYVIVKVLLYMNISKSISLEDKQLRTKTFILGAMLKAPHTNDDNTKYDPCWQTNLFIEYELDVLEFKCFQKKYRYLALCIRSLRNYLIHEFQVYGSSAHNHEREGFHAFFNSHKSLISFFTTLAFLIFLFNVFVCTMRKGSLTSLKENKSNRRISSRISKSIGSITNRVSNFKKMFTQKKEEVKPRESRTDSIDFSKYLGKATPEVPIEKKTKKKEKKGR